MACVLAVVAIVAPGHAARAQEHTGPNVDLDLLALLSAKDFIVNATGEVIWELRPSPGNRLMVVPVNVTAGQVQGWLDTSALRVRGGRLVAWSLCEPLEKAPKGSTAEEEILAAVPDGAPLITRRVAITPEGTMKWSMDRTLPGGSVKKSDRLYALKINNELLEARNPGQLPRFVQKNNESAQTFAARKQKDIAVFQVKAAQYRELRRQVTELPTDFEAPLPSRLYAVFEIPFSLRDIHFDGSDPLPWRVSVEQLESMRKTFQARVPAQPKGKGVDEVPALSREEIERVTHMEGFISDGHAYSFRAASFVISQARLVGRANPGDPLHQLLETLLTCDDAKARQVIIKEVVSTVPPTPATLALSTKAMRDMDPSTQILSLRGMLRIDGGTGDKRAETVLAEANRFLRDDKGPAPREVINALIEAGAAQPQLNEMLITKVAFEQLPADRLDPTLVAVIEQVPHSPVAAAWLNRRLLASPSPQIVRRTLEILQAAGSSTAAASAAVAASAMDGTIAALFGKPTADTGPSGKLRTPVATLEQPIPIDSVNHSLFRALQHPDKQIRGLAWEALPRFTFIPPPAATGRGAQAKAEADPYTILLDAALAQTPTPPQVVEVLANQKDTTRAAQSMVRITLRGSELASVQATRAILNNNANWPLDKALLSSELSFGDVHAFASRVYQNTTGKVPLATDLLRQRIDNNPLTIWLGKELAAGKLPDAADWAEQFPAPEKLLELTISNDVDLARGAVAALVASAGGDDRMVPGIADRFRALPDRSLNGVRNEWAKARKEIFAVRLAESAGKYRFFLRTHGAVAPAAAAGRTSTSRSAPARGAVASITPAPGSLKDDIDLGVVELQVHEGRIQLANQTVGLDIPDTQLGVRVVNLADLKNFPNPEVAQIALERYKKPVDLHLTEEKNWTGYFLLPGNIVGELTLTPER